MCCLKGQGPSTAAADTACKLWPEELHRTWIDRGTTGSEIPKTRRKQSGAHRIGLGQEIALGSLSANQTSGL